MLNHNCPQIFTNHHISSLASRQYGMMREFVNETFTLKSLATQRFPGMGYVLWRGPTPTLYCNLCNEKNASAMVDLRGPGFRMPEGSKFSKLVHPQHNEMNKEDEPTSQDYADMINKYYEEDITINGMGEGDSGVVFAGYGEPLLRLEKLMQIARIVKCSRHGVPLRIMTNGLFDKDVAEAISRDSLFNKVTVHLASADPIQYHDIMKPVVANSGRGVTSLSLVCTFIETLTQAGMEVECSVVDCGDVDIRRVRQLALALGAVGTKVRAFHK